MVWRLLCCGDASSGEPKAGDYPSEHDNECTLRGMMWADNFWLFSDSREKLICMMNDIIEELLDLNMEPKPESLWWTSTNKHEDMRTLRVEGRDKMWHLPVCEVFDVFRYRFHRDGKGFRPEKCVKPCEAGGETNTSTAAKLSLWRPNANGSAFMCTAQY